MLASRGGGEEEERCAMGLAWDKFGNTTPTFYSIVMMGSHT